MPSQYDGLWGRQIREAAARERASRMAHARPIVGEELSRLLRIAQVAYGKAPGPWGVTEANFITHNFTNGDPETGIPVAEVDCYGGYAEEITPFIAAFDPATCLALLEEVERLQQALNGVWDKAVAVVPEVGVTFPDGSEEWEGAPDFRERVIAALESTRSLERKER